MVGECNLSRTDILSEIKEAESKADASVAKAEADKKAAVAQARRDSVSKIQNEADKMRAEFESVMTAEQAALDKEKAEKLAAGEEEAAAIEAAAREKIKEVNDFLTNEFERAINASS